MVRVRPVAVRAMPLAAMSLVLAASPALAAGMPQLDFRNPLTDWQVIWGAVIFVVLYLLLSRSALPRVASVLEQRRGRIDGDLEAARQTKSEADRAIEALRLERRRASAEAKANIDRVVNEARHEAAVRTREMNTRLEAELAEAEAGIASERQRAMGSLRQVASDTAQLLVERVTGRPADRALVENRVDGLLSDRAARSAG
jgi:F-type H+-transporting ATPase subunit b